MILAHIIAKDRNQALKIINLLMDQKLLLQAVVSEKTVYEKKNAQGQLVSSKQTLIIGKTKALLFKTINDVLKTNFKTNMPMLYSVPIVYMDEELASLIRENTAKV
ncbi:divalent cation tolerance protein CutA [Maribacter sp. MJ134]|jgi:uncharacterized protein involved in tolerance to divalent cations|uniref:divalent cation tolerance protein CutA n=1 Tax=Maribacter sp. MJ134 TaxID=2496865 RepID=UPI000F82E521|nr:divalent cation tolerance protein CutA [Maribacter sp. MJ134]AZQ60122.1 divalent cation tolerance protein CutA [Maribacter sp. MJ134]